MSAKACQLCGKPLSRIRVGAEGDFCSREHRNQFRLRQGMGRLQEANQVATVMRRRENLKPLSHGRTASALPITHRECPPEKFVMTAHLTLDGFRMSPKRVALGIAARAENTRPERPRPATWRMEPRLQPQALKAAGRRAPEMRPARALKLPVQMRRAPLAKFERDVSAPAVERREYRPARTNPKRIVYPPVKGDPKVGHRAVTKNAFRPCSPPAPRSGIALRVSAACRFRLPARRMRDLRPMPNSVVSFLWKEKRHNIGGVTRPGANAPRALSIPIEMSGVICPTAPAQVGAGAFPRSPLVTSPKPTLHAPREGERRPFAVEFTAGDSASLGPEGPGFAWTPHSEARPHRTVMPPPVEGPRQSHYTLAPFVPGDLPGGLSFNLSQNGSKDHKR
jgi:hypothetical protein